MKLINNKLIWGGLLEKYVVTTWNLLYAAKSFGYGSVKKGTMGEKCMVSQPSAVARTAVLFWHLNFII